MKQDTLQTRVERANRKNRIKKCLVMMLLVIMVFSSFAILTPAASAATCGSKDGGSTVSCKDCDGTAWLSYRVSILELSGFAASVYDICTIAGNCNPHFNFSTIAASIYRMSNYTGGWIGGGGDASLISAGAAMYEVMEVVGLCLIFLFFLIDLLDEVQADSFTIEHLIKKLLTLTVAIVVMEMGEEIFSLICEMGDTMLDDAAAASAAGNTAALSKIANMFLALGGDGFFSSILLVIACVGFLIENLVPYLLMLVAVLIAYLVGFSRFIEILVRFAFAPIGIAQLVSGGAKGPGMRYIKKFASVVLQGAVAVLAFGTVTIITQAANEINAIIASLLVPITLIGFLMKVGRVADDIMGV